LYKVANYKDRNGKDEIKDYLYELSQKQNTKDARIKLNKIMEYIKQLETYGVAAGKPAIERITNTELWELRPARDRIFFAYWKDNTFVLLHHSVILKIL